MENKLLKLAKENGEVVCDKIKRADKVLDRLNGLMMKKELQGYNGLLLNPCNSIHTFFMLISIDVVFLDKNNRVVKVIYGLRPWRLTWIYFRASKVLEMKAGMLSVKLTVGEQLIEYV